MSTTQLSVTRFVRLGISSVGLSAAVLALPAAMAAADDGAPPALSKAGIEHAEQQSRATVQPPKAQIEHDELRAPAQVPAPVSADLTPDGGIGAAGWQLVLSALAGGVATGGAFVVVQQVRRHQRAGLA